MCQCFLFVNSIPKEPHWNVEESSTSSLLFVILVSSGEVFFLVAFEDPEHILDNPKHAGLIGGDEEQCCQ
jgi:hypothetical protein